MNAVEVGPEFICNRSEKGHGAVLLSFAVVDRQNHDIEIQIKVGEERLHLFGGQGLGRCLPGEVLQLPDPGGIGLVGSRRVVVHLDNGIQVDVNLLPGRFLGR